MPVVEIVIYDFICTQCDMTERKFLEKNHVDLSYNIPEGWGWKYPSNIIQACFIPKKHLYCGKCKDEHSDRMPR